MKIQSQNLKNANITFVANNLHTSFIASAFFDFLPSPTNVVQIPPFGLIDYGICNFIVDVDNRKVVANHMSGIMAESPVPKMAKKFASDVKGVEIVAIGFNYLLDITFDSEFGKYSKENFLSDQCKNKLGAALSGVGFKAYFKKTPYNMTISVEPNITEPQHAVVTANFHYEMPYGIEYQKEFTERYDELQRYINGLFE